MMQAAQEVPNSEWHACVQSLAGPVCNATQASIPNDAYFCIETMSITLAVGSVRAESPLPVRQQQGLI